MRTEHVKRDNSLNNEELIKLSRNTNDKQIRDKVINNNIPLVHSLVNRWIRNGSTENKDELIGMGLYGLVVAFDTYDLGKNIKFTSYAGKVVWMEFMKNARYNQMICRSKYTKISMDEEHRKLSSNSNGKKIFISDVVSDDRNHYLSVDDEIYRDQLAKAIDTGSFTDKEKIVAKRFYIDGKTLADIGKEFNITRQAVFQTHKRGTKKLAELMFQ
ncbi:sigma-70 family RNA polymerase sigma factor [Paenibacillus sp. ISL-20]|uniref:sigma-70 family RNA polymerase sigma factor n=1 Tax=Paenibacillus sp. ISL-20 TaxID=2819163 RepID=UPI001BEA4923|nr:sigma-70 family RNA polymerase sigma factor [Paenibacillus sp. ISL-20]MBT2760001.1 sigma-70 family RNA polymerase sigma factor [Paenibacillus sp. ISL-20]